MENDTPNQTTNQLLIHISEAAVFTDRRIPQLPVTRQHLPFSFTINRIYRGLALLSGFPLTQKAVNRLGDR